MAHKGTVKGMKRVFIYSWVLLVLGCSVAFGAGPRGLEHVVILHTNDTHGHPVKFSFRSIAAVGGLAARSTLVDRIRKKEGKVLLLDAGDINTGKAVSNLFHAKPDILGFNCLRYDAMTLGNHEFDHPLHVLREQMALASFPFLSANVKTAAGKSLANPYIIKDMGHLKVAILGLTTKETEVTGNPQNIRGLVFEDEVKTAERWVPRLRKKADLLIALVHLGIYGSSEKGSKRLAAEVEGIDLIVDGHTHTRLESPIVVKHASSDHRTIIVQAWKWGLVLGRVDLWIQNKRVVDFRYELIPINLKGAEESKAIKEDPQVLRLMEPYVEKAEAALSRRVGYAEKTFAMEGMRRRETALGDLVADSMLWSTRDQGTVFALQNGGGIRDVLPRGPITMKEVYDVLPFDNTVVVLTLKGSQVQALFDYMGSLEAGAGAFPQVSEGVSLTLDKGRGKCRNVRLKGQPIDPRKEYKMATNSYLAQGGDGYHILDRALEKYDTAMFQRDVLIKYIRFLSGRLQPKTEGRIAGVN